MDVAARRARLRALAGGRAGCRRVGQRVAAPVRQPVGRRGGRGPRCARRGLAPELFGLEITESVLVDDADETVALLDELKALGVRIALDDFGTGYSSLTYLHQLPIDELKIDRSFVAVLEDESSDLVLLQMMVQLGRAFDLKVVAEGIDTDRKLRRIQRLGCHYGQGYLFARPAPFEQVMHRLPRRRPTGAAARRAPGRAGGAGAVSRP